AAAYAYGASPAAATRSRDRAGLCGSFVGLAQFDFPRSNSYCPISSFVYFHRTAGSDAARRGDDAVAVGHVGFRDQHVAGFRDRVADVHRLAVAAVGRQLFTPRAPFAVAEDPRDGLLYDPVAIGKLLRRLGDGFGRVRRARSDAGLDRHSLHGLPD